MLQYLQQFDKKIFEKFELEEKNNLYILTYKGDKKDAAALLEKMSNQYFEKMSEYTGKQIVLDNIEVDNFDVIITIEKKKKQI
ncbi:hypothetical protein K6959_15960 [Bacillus aquiflavi]|uniref:DUF6612 family protein n=1 Tax=Bacillus aquiflavi TaxID=2672567 RepID=UPI001CA8D3D3|nr:DUF6612 family protein [Bacillus aquiflavi]UAC48057.1 hypothetical protein K6959_15960 [Bacillus aquiflavi]